VSTQSIFNPTKSAVACILDRKISDAGRAALMYEKYKVGCTPDRGLLDDLVKMGDIFCTSECYLNEEEQYLLMEKINRISI